MIPVLFHYPENSYLKVCLFGESKLVFMGGSISTPQSTPLVVDKKDTPDKKAKIFKTNEKFKSLEKKELRSQTLKKLEGLRERVGGEEYKKFKKISNVSDFFNAIYERDGGGNNKELRKNLFNENKAEIEKFGNGNLGKNFSGTAAQNIALQKWMKNTLFSPQSKEIVDNQFAKKNPNVADFVYNQKNEVPYSHDTSFNRPMEPKTLAQAGAQYERDANGNFETSDKKYEAAFSRLKGNMTKKGIKMYKDTVKIITDISENKMIVKKGRETFVYPVVFSKSGVGSAPGSKKTPMGSFSLKTRSVNGIGKPASSTPNITGAAISVNGLESSNANSFGRGVLIHGMPEVTQGDIVQRAKTYGCYGLTEPNAIALAERIQGSPNAVMEVVA